MLDLESREEIFVWECIESIIMSDDREIYIYKSILDNFGKKTGEGKIDTTINLKNWGNHFYFYGCHRW